MWKIEGFDGTTPGMHRTAPPRSGIVIACASIVRE
jgi:hypothetical protein